LIMKPKFHFLVHLPAYIHHFRPVIIFSTEQYKSFNHVFQLTCIHSNWQGPSQDTCWTFVSTFPSKHPTQACLLGIMLDELKNKSADAAGE
ncbi:hypothetical protein PISMIDRAFT_123122, partial [Pisolithus microcarpus 441]